jgi:hypothetical protein
LDLAGQFERRVQHTVADLGGGKQLPKTLTGTIERIGQDSQSLIGLLDGMWKLIAFVLVLNSGANEDGHKVLDYRYYLVV